MWISHFQKPVLSAVVFFGTILALSVGYAAYSSISSSEYAAGQTLSSTLFGKVAGNLEDLNGRMSNFSFSWGNVGIGTNSPKTSLDIGNGRLRVQWLWTVDATDTGAWLELLHNETHSTIQSYNRANSSFLPIRFRASQLELYTGSAERLRIDGVWNIGIWLTSPSVKLDINWDVKSNRSVDQQYISISWGDAGGIYLKWSSRESNKKPLIFQSFHNETGSAAGNLGFRFQVGAESSPSTLMTMSEQGNVGIGTTSPSEKLDVSGNIKASGAVLMGYERVSVDCSNTTSCVATCPTGKKVLGGGCVRINGGANNLQDAMPSYDTTFNCNWATAPITSRAYAICARIGN